MTSNNINQINRKEVRYIHDTKTHNPSAAQEVVPTIMKWFKPISVVDVGCGLGDWIAVFKQNGVKEILGIDGEYVDISKLMISQDDFLAFNIEEVLRLDKRFDLAVCLEVVEHLPLKSANNIVETLTNLSDVILFSAAIPDQGGQNHLNEQWIGYWEEKFNAHGYHFYDELRALFWDNKKINICYRQNMILAIKESVDHDFEKNKPILNIVHPEYFTRKSKRIYKLEKKVAWLEEFYRANQELESSIIWKIFKKTTSVKNKLLQKINFKKQL